MSRTPVPSRTQTVAHEIAPVWNAQSRVLLLGTMPSPASRGAVFFYMHPQNRFWRVLPAVFGETLSYANNGTRFSGTKPDVKAAIAERRAFLLRHAISLWDVLSRCDIDGASDATIRNAVPNDFHELFEKSHIARVFCTGKTAFSLWHKFCAAEYEGRFGLTVRCLPSTSPANAAWSLEKLINAYSCIAEKEISGTCATTP